MIISGKKRREDEEFSEINRMLSSGSEKKIEMVDEEKTNRMKGINECNLTFSTNGYTNIFIELMLTVV